MESIQILTSPSHAGDVFQNEPFASHRRCYPIKEADKGAKNTEYSPQAKLTLAPFPSSPGLTLNVVLPAWGNEVHSEKLKSTEYSPQAKLSPAHYALSPGFISNTCPSTLSNGVHSKELKRLEYSPQFKLIPRPSTSSPWFTYNTEAPPTPSNRASSDDTSFHEALFQETGYHPKGGSGTDPYNLCHFLSSNNLLSQPLFASPNPSLLTEADASLSCSQRTRYLDPEEFFEQHCTQKSIIGSPPKTPCHLSAKVSELPSFTSFLPCIPGNLQATHALREYTIDPPALDSGALNVVSLTFDGEAFDNDALFTFDINESPDALESDVAILLEETMEASSLHGGSVTLLKRARCQDKLEAMQSMAKRRAANWKNRLPPKKEKAKAKAYTYIITNQVSLDASIIVKGDAEVESSDATGNMRISEALGWCKCKYSRCLKLYCDCFRNGLICGVECKCKKCQNTEQGNSSEGIATETKAIIRERRPDAFEVRVVKVGEGCSCKKNRCLKKYCACVADGLACDEGRCICNDCENTMVARMSRKMEATDSGESVTASIEENSQVTDKNADRPASTPIANDEFDAEVAISNADATTISAMCDELTPERFSTIEV